MLSPDIHENPSMPDNGTYKGVLEAVSKVSGILPVSLERARDIASLFDVPKPLIAYDFEGKGNINRQAFLIVAGLPGLRSEYLLQMLNPEVFAQPQMVMAAMDSCTRAQQKALSAGILRPDEQWETIRLIPTAEGKAFLDVSGAAGSECWRLMHRIGNAHSYKGLREIPDPAMRLQTAEQAGKGLALFGTLTAAMDVSSIVCTLPGYRDTRLYYRQLKSVLAGNRTLRDAEEFLPAEPVLRESTAQHFLLHLNPEDFRKRLEDSQLRRLIDIALAQESFALTLQTGLMSGSLKKVVVHGDTKLDNFLFDTDTGRAKAIVDLDTIMPHTWLSDWGDLARSLVNIAGERETDPAKVTVNLDVFQALAKGFLGSARHAQSFERGLMVEAAQIMALELGVRFLTDHLRGDSYFRLTSGEPQDLNKTRAMVQFLVFERLRDREAAAKNCIEKLGWR